MSTSSDDAAFGDAESLLAELGDIGPEPDDPSQERSASTLSSERSASSTEPPHPPAPPTDRVHRTDEARSVPPPSVPAPVTSGWRSHTATCSVCKQVCDLEDWQLQGLRWRCHHCGALNERGRATTQGSASAPEPTAHPDLAWQTRADEAAKKRADRRVGSAAMRTAWLVIALNVLCAVGTFAWGTVTHAEPATAIAVGLLVAVVFYVLTFLLVVVRMDELGVQPLWLPDGATHPVAFGALVGVGAWSLVAGFAFLTSGHLVIDPFAGLLVAGASLPRILFAIGLLVVAGPWIEELLFRGLVLESLRARGAATALVASSVLFAICHLHGLIYYSLAGALLGGVYLKSGLKASLWTHAAFNACFVVTAIAVTLGPAHAVSLEGMSFRTPATWRSADRSALGAADFGAAGPSGALLSVGHDPIPSTVSVDVQRLADGINRGSVPTLPGMDASLGEAHTLGLPAGPAVEAPGTINGHAVRLVLVPAPGRMWILVLFTGGSGQAEKDFNTMLQSVRFTT